MAKFTHDREDLLRDATGYDFRIEMRCPDFAQPIFCGFRASNAFSVYFGQETVVQFNLKNELRRAFWRDRMLASFKRELHWVDRVKSARMRLVRQPLTEAESREFLDSVAALLTRLSVSLKAGSYEILGMFPENADVFSQVSAWLFYFHEPIVCAVHPGVGKR